MNANGTGHVQIALGSAPDWSPFGSEIAYEHADDIYVAKADGQQPDAAHRGRFERVGPGLVAERQQDRVWIRPG
jgi:hypothetical protein